MSSRKILVLLASVVVAAVAAFGLFALAGDSDGGNEEAADATVWRAVEVISQGDFGQDAAKKLEEVDIASNLVPDGAVTDPEALTDLVAVRDIGTGQFVVRNDFGSQTDNEAAGSVTPVLSNDAYTLVTVGVDSVRGVSGLVRPGDYVNVYFRAEGNNNESIAAEAAAEAAAEPTPTATDDTAEGGLVPAQLPAAANDDANLPDSGVVGTRALWENPVFPIYQKVRVAAVGQEAIRQPGQVDDEEAPPVDTTLITLELPPEAVQRVMSVGDGNHYLALVSPDYDPIPLLGVSEVSELPWGFDTPQLSAYDRTEFLALLEEGE